MTLKKGYNPKQNAYKVFLRLPKSKKKKAQENIARSFLYKFGHPKHDKAKLKLTKYKKQPSHTKNWKLFRIDILKKKRKK